MQIFPKVCNLMKRILKWVMWVCILLSAASIAFQWKMLSKSNRVYVLAVLCKYSRHFQDCSYSALKVTHSLLRGSCWSGVWWSSTHEQSSCMGRIFSDRHSFSVKRRSLIFIGLSIRRTRSNVISISTRLWCAHHKRWHRLHWCWFQYSTEPLAPTARF